MRVQLLSTLFFLACFNIQTMYCLDEEFCKESQMTVRRVQSCPQNISMWRDREKIKACNSIIHTCSRELVYHCLINPWQNETIEVCAPATYINAGYCAEYNKRGGKVQEYFEPTCPSCVEKYLSTDAYLHPECYKPVYQVEKNHYQNATNIYKVDEINSLKPTTKRDEPDMVSRAMLWQSRSYFTSYLVLFVLITSSFL